MLFCDISKYIKVREARIFYKLNCTHLFVYLQNIHKYNENEQFHLEVLYIK